MRHEVFFISQKRALPPDWQNRGCGTTCLKMVLDYWDKGRGVTVQDLVARGEQIGAYQPNVGWVHSGLVNLALEHGCIGFNRDFAPQSKTPLDPEAAFSQLLEDLELGPVLASVWSGFDPANGGGHVVVVSGWDGANLFILDPEKEEEGMGRLSLKKVDFMKAWKLRTICISGA